MKSLVKVVLLAALLASVYGCASSGEKEKVTHLRPPDLFNPYYMAYTKLPGQKVCVIAVDPDGKWAYGYASGRATLEEAAAKAAESCDASRTRYRVFAEPKLFAINDKIVYYDNIP